MTDDGLAMNNPNSPASPVLGAPPPGELSGPLADQIQQVLTEQVNPAIAGHGGQAELMSVDGSVAYMRLGGGCQGCGMASVTLKQGIERILKEAIPEVTEVVDVTDHASGDNPYYQAAKK
ncbi:MAG: NifU family protein, partial [Acidimicrobiia bacterium]